MDAGVNKEARRLNQETKHEGIRFGCSPLDGAADSRGLFPPSQILNIPCADDTVKNDSVDQMPRWFGRLSCE